jgi:linoleoyl-CoA desaturase
VPDKYLKGTPDSAPETNSEAKFRGLRGSLGVDPVTGKRRGLRTAMREYQSSRAAA